MAYRMLTDLADACRASGLRVVEVSGWRQRGRPASTGGFDPRGVVAHHTGGGGEGYGYAAGTLVAGVAGLPGPLCHIGLGRDGTVYVIAAGRANHAGKSRSFGFMRAGDGNSQAIGIEAMNSGYEGWSAAQLSAYHRLCRTLCDWYGWPRWHVLGHGETSTAGKWDPGVGGRMIDMHAFRVAIENAAAPTPAPAPKPLLPEEIDMPAVTKLWRSKPLDLPAGAYIVPLEDRVDSPTSVLAPGAGAYVFDVTWNVVLDRVPVGRDIKLQCVLTDGNTRTIKRAFDWVEVHGTPGMVAGQLTCKETVRAGERLRLVIDTENTGARLRTIKTVCHYWKA